MVPRTLGAWPLAAWSVGRSTAPAVATVKPSFYGRHTNVTAFDPTD